MSIRPFAALLGACALSSTAFAGTVTKDPDLGAYWWPLHPTNGSYVYANSFVADADADVTDLGAWLLPTDGAGTGSTVAFEVWGESPAGGPDAGNVIASTGLMDLGGGAGTLEYYSGSPAFSGMLTAGTRYWFAISVVGGTGSYWQTGGHSQNSQQLDNGTFWYSNDPAGVSFDGQGFTPELAFSVTTGADYPIDLEIAGTCGGPGTVGVYGLTPGGRFSVLRGNDLSGATVPVGRCTGTWLDIGGVKQLATLTADVNGEYHFKSNLPASLCGRYVQVLDVDTCEISNVAGPF